MGLIIMTDGIQMNQYLSSIITLLTLLLAAKLEGGGPHLSKSPNKR